MDGVAKHLWHEGGARLGGVAKKIHSEAEPLVSIVTVVFNDVSNLQRTIDSIASQTYQNIEHIVIDGGSTDGTLDIIKRSSSIDYWISERDSGIYDAMNKGVSVASGEWVNFMNSGDVFFAPTVVSAIYEVEGARSSDLIYGDVEVDYGEFRIRREAGDVSALKKGMQFSHQSLFSRRKILIDIPFDTSYRTAADYNFIVSCWVNQRSFFRIGLVVSSITSGGVSDVRRLSSHQQRIRVLNSFLELSFMDRLRLWAQAAYIFYADLARSILPGWVSDWIKKIK